MELWNFAISTCLLDIPLSAENASVLTESMAPSDLYFSALSVQFTYLLTYFTKEATQTIHHFVQNCSRYIENYCFKHKNFVGCRGASPSWPPTGGSAPWTPLGVPPQTPIIGSRSRARHGCVFDPHFSLPSAAPGSPDSIPRWTNGKGKRKERGGQFYIPIPIWEPPQRGQKYTEIGVYRRKGTRGPD